MLVARSIALSYMANNIPREKAGTALDWHTPQLDKVWLTGYFANSLSDVSRSSVINLPSNPSALCVYMVIFPARPVLKCYSATAVDGKLRIHRNVLGQLKVRQQEYWCTRYGRG